MSDDLSAKAANWVPPWQRPADSGSGAEADSEAEAGPEAGPEAAADAGDAAADEVADEGLPGQWDKLAGAKWQTVRQDASPEETGVQSETEDGESWDDGGADLEAVDAQAVDAQAVDAQAVDRLPVDPEAVDAQAEDRLPGDPEAANAEAVDRLPGDPEAANAEAVDPRAVDAEAAVAESEEWATVDGSSDAAVESVDGLAVDDLAVDDLAVDDLAVDDLAEDSGDTGVWAAEVGGGLHDLAADIVRASSARIFVPAQRVDEEDRPAITEAELVAALEAILMVVDEPVSEITLAQVLDVPAEQVANALIDLSVRYTQEGKGFDLRRAAGGWRFYTRAEYSSYVERFVLDGQQLRLTQASLETLAVVAYKQPVTRSRISAIRGVNCDGVVRTLIARGMIEECGMEPESGAHLYRTTTLFLEKLGLDSVEQLPPLAPFLPENLDEVALNE